MATNLDLHCLNCLKVGNRTAAIIYILYFSSDSRQGLGGLDIYFINLNILPDYTDLYCFAAHAEVSSSNGGETAWAGQIGGQNSEDNSEEEYTVMDFDGNSWAMYIQASQTSCDVVDTETPDDDGTR